MHWLLGALKEAGAGGLLGFYQLLQALEHGQTQGLEPGGRHRQEDSLIAGRDRERGTEQGSTQMLGPGPTAPDWLISSHHLSPAKDREEAGPYLAGPLALRNSQQQTLLSFKAECHHFYSKDSPV